MFVGGADCEARERLLRAPALRAAVRAPAFGAPRCGVQAEPPTRHEAGPQAKSPNANARPPSHGGPRMVRDRDLPRRGYRRLVPESMGSDSCGAGALRAARPTVFVTAIARQQYCVSPSQCSRGSGISWCRGPAQGSASPCRPTRSAIDLIRPHRPTRSFPNSHGRQRGLSAEPVMRPRGSR